MAYRHARAGACESGTCISGLVPYVLRCTIGGVERGMQIPGFSISHNVGQPSTCTFSVEGFSVLRGEEVRISDDGVSNLLFGGTVMGRRRRIQTNGPTLYDLQAQDWTWLANKQARVYERFDGLSANVAVRRVLAHCDPALGLSVGSIPHSLGTVTLSFQGEPVMEAVGRIANAAEASYELTPDKRINMFQDEPPHGQVIRLWDNTNVKNLVIEDFLSQVRTRVWYEGGGPQTTALMSAGATTIPVAECGWFSASGGTARAETSVITYTGRSAASGPGFLTGVTGLLYDLPQGVSVNVFVKIDDAVKQAALASVLGGGFSGVSIYYQADGRLSIAEITGRAQQHVAFHGEPTQAVTCTVDDRIPGARDWQVGRLVDVDVTDQAGETLAGTFRIASVVIRGFGEVFTQTQPTAPRSLRLERDVTLRPGVRQGVIDLLVGAS